MADESLRRNLVLGGLPPTPLLAPTGAWTENALETKHRGRLCSLQNLGQPRFHSLLDARADLAARTTPWAGGGRAVGRGAHVLLAVALQEEQVGRLVEGEAHGVPGALLGALGGSGAQAALTDGAAQPGRGRAPGTPRSQDWGSLGTVPLQPPGLGVYP